VRQFTHGGQQHVIGRSEAGYGIWLVGREHEDPLISYPPTDDGWNRAWSDFSRLEPNPQPLSSPSAPVLAPPPYAPPSPVPYAPPVYGVPATPPQGFAVAPAYGAVPGYPVPVGVPPRGNGMATTGGTLGIVGAALSLIPLIGIFIGLVMGVLAIIFGGVGMSRATNLGGAGKGMAVTGLVLGILTVIFKLIPGVNLI
jgi:hypothetical protein